jgi:ABC-type branched-chain amino acid transport systems, ATPase component
MPDPIIKTTDLTRRFGDLTAVDRLNIEVAAARSSASWDPMARAKPPLSACSAP